MDISPEEQKARAVLPFIRFILGILPPGMVNWLIKMGADRTKLNGVVRETVNIDGVSCEWIIPHGCSTDRVLLYLHGGGFVFGLTPLHLQMGAYLAKKTSIRVLMVDYRTAPQFPFPAALDDCLAAYYWLMKQGVSPQNIVIAGDSAGGNLAITMLMKMRDSEDELPAAAACLSPVTDLTGNAKRRKDFEDPLLSSKTIKFFNRSYLSNNDPKNPLISPVFGNFEGLPSLLIHVGEEEILRDDAMRITDLARSAGVDVQLEIFPRMWHVWQLNLSMSQAVNSLDTISEFFNKHLSNS